MKAEPGPPDPPGRDREGEGEREPSGLERWVAPFFTDSTLWPVLFVALAIALTSGAALLLMALRERNPFAFAALAVAGWLSAEAVRLERRTGGLGRVALGILGLWGAAALLAAVAGTSGLF